MPSLLLALSLSLSSAAFSQISWSLSSLSPHSHLISLKIVISLCLNCSPKAIILCPTSTLWPVLWHSAPECLFPLFSKVLQINSSFAFLFFFLTIQPKKPLHVLMTPSVTFHRPSTPLYSCSPNLCMPRFTFHWIRGKTRGVSSLRLCLSFSKMPMVVIKGCENNELWSFHIRCRGTIFAQWAGSEWRLKENDITVTASTLLF